jgi:hypothetical protein
MHRCDLHGANTGTRGGDRKEGPPNKERGDGVCDGSLQNHSGANLNPKTAKDRSKVPKGGKAGRVALTACKAEVPVKAQAEQKVEELREAAAAAARKSREASDEAKQICLERKKGLNQEVLEM